MKNTLKIFTLIAAVLCLTGCGPDDEPGTGSNSISYIVSSCTAPASPITANYDTKERCAVWFPSAETGKDATGCNVPGAVFTNDFILFPTLELKKGESLSVEIQ